MEDALKESSLRASLNGVLRRQVPCRIVMEGFSFESAVKNVEVVM